MSATETLALLALGGAGGALALWLFGPEPEKWRRHLAFTAVWSVTFAAVYVLMT
jgi:hypothetical protein